MKAALPRVVSLSRCSGNAMPKALMATAAGRPKTYLDLAREVDGVPHDPEGYKKFFNEYCEFRIAGQDGHLPTFGYIPTKVVKEIDWPRGWTLDLKRKHLSLDGGINVRERSELVFRAVSAISNIGKAANLDAPKGEMLPVFGDEGEHLLNIDRAAAMVFGTVSYGVQMIAYIRTEKGKKYWVPRRSKTKRSYPGMLDVCVGGALNTGEDPLTCLVREAKEEASLPEDYIRRHLQPYGTVSYHMATDGNGEEGHQPQRMHVYRIELSPGVVPKPLDGEVEKFELMTLEEVQTALKNGEFKTNCAATWLSHFVERGVINGGNEPEMLEISTHLHRPLKFPTREFVCLG